jgi:hypothetical protein
MGVQVSEVDNVEEARAIVREAKYPPIGNRGISGQGMHTGYRSHGARHASEYAPWANANIIVCVSIESLEAQISRRSRPRGHRHDCLCPPTSVRAWVHLSSSTTFGQRCADRGPAMRTASSPGVGDRTDRGILGWVGAEPARHRRRTCLDGLKARPSRHAAEVIVPA